MDVEAIDDFHKKMNDNMNIKIPHEETEFIKDIIFEYWFKSPLDNNLTSVEVKFDHESTLASEWMVGKPLKLVVHGWRHSSADEPGSFSIKDAYVNSQQFNTITMNWSNIATSKYYFKVARLSGKVGIVLGHFLINLVTIGFVKPSDIHVIGHSIGAHVAGKCGDVFFNLMQEKIDRITGLDPSSPGFKDSWLPLWRETERLDKDDANFVDVIHTAKGFQGISKPIGHVDFYPNNGKSPQPGCNSFIPCENLHCSHCRAYIYYRESVDVPLTFQGSQCSSMKEYTDGKCNDNPVNFMGHDANENNQGKFYLKTNDKKPYGIFSN